LSNNDLENILLPNDLNVIRNQEVDHGGYVGHQEDAREPRKRAQESGGPIQFRVQDHLAFKLMHMTHMTSDLDVLYIHEKIFSMQPVSWSTKIGVSYNHQNKIIF
jgi:hypothetical protein